MNPCAGWRFLFTLILLAPLASFTAAEAGGNVLLLHLEGAIGPAGSDYVDRALERAERERAQLLVLRLDTPGGLDTAMRAIVKRIIGSSVPVVGYVAPGGARAASAGTYILYATHLAAMAPGTNLGAATPVQLGGLPQLEDQKDPPHANGETPDAASAPSTPKDSMKAKLVNDAAAYLRSLARLRGRNAQWAETAVREAASLSAQEAFELGVIDLVAVDVDDLLGQIDGLSVQLPGGQRVLQTQAMRLIEVPPDWRTRLLSVISNPNVAYILMLVGIYGLIYEFANPGAILPGTAGAVSLLLALYAFQVLPVNYAGMALMLLGIALMAAEAFMPSFGALGIGGVIAFILGSLILIDTEQAGLGISLPLIISVGIMSAFLLLLVIGMALRSRKRPVVSGREELIGADGLVTESVEGGATVRVHGELWSAESSAALRTGQRVRVDGRNGLKLQVAPMDTKESDS